MGLQGLLLADDVHAIFRCMRQTLVQLLLQAAGKPIMTMFPVWASCLEPWPRPPGTALSKFGGACLANVIESCLIFFCFTMCVLAGSCILTVMRIHTKLAPLLVPCHSRSKMSHRLLKMPGSCRARTHASCSQVILLVQIGLLQRMP